LHWAKAVWRGNQRFFRQLQAKDRNLNR
jgi:hypothetical protein